ncbi:MAG TPA: SRPBCC domain-containing protein [Planctomycetota bacterium]|nr:SRPBCC domain-containing protein [Planctomycetota bacterium]
MMKYSAPATFALCLLCVSSGLSAANADKDKDKDKEAAMAANEDAFTYSIYIGTNPAAVWSSLIDKEVVSKYYLAPLTSIEPREGGSLSYGDGMITGKILTWEPNAVLRHTFLFAGSGAEETTVEYRLEPAADSDKVTLLTITHTGLEKAPDIRQHISSGWVTILSSLKTLLETGKVIQWK